MLVNEYTGKTIDEALSAALSKLQLEKDDVIIEVLEEPSKGFLGIGTRDAKVRVTPKNLTAKKAKDFLNEVFSHMNLDVSLQVKEDGKDLNIALTGSEMGIVIGRGGETLDALQYLTNLSVNKEEGQYVRVHLDTENYRQKREDTLVRLAHKMADRVIKYHRNITLEPMNPNERRIIHSTLHQHKVVSTFSVGEEPNRKVVISLKNRSRKPRPAQSNADTSEE